MVKMICLIVVGIIIGVVAINGCSEDAREEMSDRVSSATKALTGKVRADSEKTPRVVREQQRKERHRQDTTWTPENRAAHPLEYCQAQLEELVNPTLHVRLGDELFLPRNSA